jgi:hypothetical protein
MVCMATTHALLPLSEFYRVKMMRWHCVIINLCTTAVEPLCQGEPPTEKHFMNHKRKKTYMIIL